LLEPLRSSGRARGILLGAVGLAIGLSLLVLALRGVDLSELTSALAEARYVWLLPLVAVAMLSHLIRAWRWNLIIGSMQSDRGRRPRLAESFGAVMIGYMVNYGVPRLGEVARAGVLARRTRLPFVGLAGTVAAERALDTASLAVALIIAAVLLRSQPGGVFAVLSETGATGGFLVMVGIGTLFVAALVAILVAVTRGHLGAGPARLAQSFVDGLRAILVVTARMLVALQTVVIWVCYWMMGYIPLEMLGLVDAYSLGLADAWSIMTIGALGVLVPSPGGLGTYHLLTVETLSGLYGVHVQDAATYAVLAHGVQLLAYVVAGLVSLAIFGWGTARQPNQAPDAEGDVPSGSTGASQTT